MKNEAEYISRKYLNHDSKSPYLECSLLGLSLAEAERILKVVGIHSRVQTYTLNTIKQYMVSSILNMTLVNVTKTEANNAETR